MKANQKEQPKTMKEENKTISVPVKKVKNESHLLKLVSYGQVAPNTQLNVAFEVQGKLERGAIDMKPGTNFKKGQALYMVDNKTAYFSFQSRKAALGTMVVSMFPDIELDFPSELNKWYKFYNGLDVKSDALPDVPKPGSVKEDLFLVGRNFYIEYYNLVSLQYQLTKKYTFIAPFSGTVIETYAEPGSIANPGAQVAKIARTDNYEVKVPVAVEDLESYKGESTAYFIDPNGKKIGTGTIVRISDVINQQTQSADIYYSIKALEGETIYNGMFVNVSINKEDEQQAVILPRTAVQGNKVNVLDGNKIKSYDVTVILSIPDSVYVTGLSNDLMVILEQLGGIDLKAKYEGISR